MLPTLSVTEVNHYVKQLLDADPLLNWVTVRGEISNYKMYPSGHHYFTLKDAESSLRCVMFRSAAARLRFRPENGMAVTGNGRIRVFPRDGAYQFYVEALHPEGAGDLQVAFAQLKEKLEKEGLFDSAHKKPLPRYPGRIAVITSSAGAAVRDIIRVLGKRWPLAKVLVLPVRVQGTEAPMEIVGALQYANRWKLADLIIVGRGGGSIEDLWAFNDERVARAIFASQLPVISAVGHEPDVTIADFVADLRAATPSNAAELAVPDVQELLEQLADREQRLGCSMDKQLQQLRQRVEERKNRPVLRTPTAYLDQKRMELDLLHSRLLSAAENHIAAARRAEVALAAKLDALSPLKVLARGYSLATDEAGTVIRDAEQITTGDRIHLRLEKGGLHCQVLEVNYGNKKANI